MKMNIKGLVFVGFAAAVFASAANADLPAAADQPKTVTSVKFTEATYQKKLTEGANIDIDGNNVISADVGVKGIKENGAQTTLTIDDNGIVELPAAQTVGDGTLNVKVGNNTVATFTANEATANTINVELGTAAGLGTATTISSSSTNNDAATAKAVYDYVDSEIDDLTTYTNGTNITFTPGQNAGDPTTISTSAQVNVLEGVQVNGVDQTIDANKKVNLGAAAGKAVDTTITSAAADTAVPTSKAVYDFLNNGASTANCSDTNPCAFVLGSGGVPEWKPIQQ